MAQVSKGSEGSEGPEGSEGSPNVPLPISVISTILFVQNEREDVN